MGVQTIFGPITCVYQTNGGTIFGTAAIGQVAGIVFDGEQFNKMAGSGACLASAKLSDGQVIEVTCETAGDPPPCLPSEPGACPIDSPSSSTMTLAEPMADPPCTITVQQVVAVSELFKAPKKPKVGDTVVIQLDIQAPTKAKDAAQNAIDLVTKKGKTVASVNLVTKVFQVDDLGALVVYVEVRGIEVRANVYTFAAGVEAGTGAKLALPVVLPQAA